MVSKKSLARGMAAAFGMTMLPLQAFAQQSPEFAYSAEKWAALRDNVLEYDEIADLVHEYNNTVIQNSITYKDEKDDSRDDMAQDYYDRANEIYSNIEYPDSDDSSYGSRMAAALQNEQSARELMKQGDEAVEDSETRKLGYDKAEAELVKQAQTQMISYWSQYYRLDSLRAEKSQAESSYQSEQNRLNAGMTTQSRVLSAREAVSSAEAAIVSAESSLETGKANLCLMLGWGYGTLVELGELPEADLERIAAINAEADTEKALEKNFAYRISTKQLANARTDSVKQKLAQTVKAQQAAIAADVKDRYAGLLLARSNLEQAMQALDLEQTAMNLAEVQIQAGTITRNAYQTRQASFQTAEVTVRTRRLELLQAMVDYDWAVNGLASVS